jgi:poly(hydroxyalkanoate) depolymerase family esterase
MIRRIAAVALAVGTLCTALVIGATAEASSSAFTRHRYVAKDPHFTRDYWVFVPRRHAVHPALVVFLHGCVDTDPARDAAKATKWNRLAAKKGFLVVYPEQRIDQTGDGNAASNGNGTGCWNWFQPVNQTRGTGETATIAGITIRIIASYGIDKRRVYVMGISAGADMAVNLAAAYPDLYASMSVLAACAYATCGDWSGGLAFEQMGPRKRVVPVIAVQSVTDNLNNALMGTSAVQQWLGTDDLADNGAMDESISRNPASVSHHGIDASLVAGIGTVGDTCVRPQHWGCPGALLGWKSYPYSVARYTDAKGRVVLESWTLYGALHAYPNGDPSAEYTDPIGPDVTSASYKFFRSHPMGTR